MKGRRKGGSERNYANTDPCQENLDSVKKSIINIKINKINLIQQMNSILDERATRPL